MKRKGKRGKGQFDLKPGFHLRIRINVTAPSFLVTSRAMAALNRLQQRIKENIQVG